MEKKVQSLSIDEMMQFAEKYRRKFESKWHKKYILAKYNHKQVKLAAKRLRMELNSRDIEQRDKSWRFWEKHRKNFLMIDYYLAKIEQELQALKKYKPGLTRDLYDIHQTIAFLTDKINDNNVNILALLGSGNPEKDHPGNYKYHDRYKWQP